MNDIPIHDYIKTRWIDIYPQDDTRDDSDLQLLCSSLLIFLIDWCDEEFLANRHKPFTSRELAGKGGCEEMLQKVHSNWFGSILHGIKNEKKGEKRSTSL